MLEPSAIECLDFFHLACAELGFEIPASPGSPSGSRAVGSKLIAVPALPGPDETPKRNSPAFRTGASLAEQSRGAAFGYPAALILRRPSLLSLRFWTGQQHVKEMAMSLSDDLIFKRFSDFARNPEEQDAHMEALLGRIRELLPQIEELLAEIADHWGEEDGIYRFYHQSFKVFGLQQITKARKSGARLILWTAGTIGSLLPYCPEEHPPGTHGEVLTLDVRRAIGCRR